MQTTTIGITGMSCGHCVGAVTRALKAVPGLEVNDVKVGSATVAYDPARVTMARITEVIEDEGYGVMAAK